jgi:hypothetical protein
MPWRKIMRLFSFAIPALAAAAAVFHSNTARAQFDGSVDLYLDFIGAISQTDVGIDEDDEIYFIVSAVDSHNQLIVPPYRVPQTFYEIQAGQVLEKHDKLFARFVAPEDWIMINVQMIEDDSSDVAGIFSAITNTLSQWNLPCSVDPTLCAVPGLSQLLQSVASAVFNSRGSDDYFGGFNVIALSRGGVLYTHFQSGPGMALIPGWVEGWTAGTGGWNFNNDVDGKYWATFSVY